MKVPFLDLGAAYEELATELDEAYRAVMGSGRFLLGEQLAAFEEEFADFSGAAHCAAVGSGFDALASACARSASSAATRFSSPPTGPRSPGSRSPRSAPSRSGSSPARRPTRSTPTGSTRPAPRAPGRSSRSTSTGGRPRWPRSSPGRGTAGCGSWRMRRRPTARGSTGTGIGALGDAVAWSFYPSKNLGAFSDGGCLTSDDPDARRPRAPAAQLWLGGPRRDRRGRRQQPPRRAAGGLPPGAPRPPRRVERAPRRQRAPLPRRPRRAAAHPSPADDATTRSAWHHFVIRVADRDRVREDLAAARGRDSRALSRCRPRRSRRSPGFAAPPGAYPIAASGWRPRCSACRSARISRRTAPGRWSRRWSAALSR